MALRIVLGLAIKLIQAEDDHVGKIELMLLVQANQFTISSYRCAAGWQADNGRLPQVRTFADQTGDNRGRVPRSVLAGLEHE